MRYQYQIKDVVDADFPEFAARCHSEWSDIRRIVSENCGWSSHNAYKMLSALDFGCGFGRNLGVLVELALKVCAVEREDILFEKAQQLYPQVSVSHVKSLAQKVFPVEHFNLVLSHTVLQHLRTSEAIEAAAEIARITKKGGYVLLTEETNPLRKSGDLNNPMDHCCTPRSVEDYHIMLGKKSFKLVYTEERILERTYRFNGDCGHYMLFKRL